MLKLVKLKKLFCLLLAAVLLLGLCACEMPDTTEIYVGTWTCEANEEQKLKATELVMNGDYTATMIFDGETYAMTWRISPENPDAIEFLTVNEYKTVEEKFPVLKGGFTMIDGEMYLNIYDGNARDDDFSIATLVMKVG